MPDADQTSRHRLWQQLQEQETREADWSSSDRSVPSPLQCRLLILSTLLMASLAILWGGVYFVFDEVWAAIIPWTYAGISFTNLTLLRKPAHYRLLRSSQLLLSLCLPFMLMWSLGGMVDSSAVVLWSFTCPMGALVFAGRRQAMGWFLAFLGLVVATAFVDYPDLQPTNNLPDFVVVAMFVMNLAGVSLVAFLLIRYFVIQSALAYNLLGRERDKTERLVRNMLPEAVAERLKREAQPIADRIDSVAIVFVDIVGFTPFSMNHSPEVVVRMLDEVFSGFDELAAGLGLEKIKTIGDAYMVCGGLSGERRGTAGAATFALDARDAMAKVAVDDVDGFTVRVGMHVGTVIAGVIGRSKYSYDVWGDAVNVAARLQQGAPPGEVVVSDAARRSLGPAFEYEPQGRTSLKGHAPVATFLLRRRTGSTSRSGPEISAVPPNPPSATTGSRTR